jgi:hypothetical protein
MVPHNSSAVGAQRALVVTFTAGADAQNESAIAAFAVNSFVLPTRSHNSQWFMVWFNIELQLISVMYAERASDCCNQAVRMFPTSTDNSQRFYGNTYWHGSNMYVEL